MKEEREGKRTTLTLIIRNIGQHDFISYSCHAVNPIGHAEGTIKLYGM